MSNRVYPTIFSLFFLTLGCTATAEREIGIKGESFKKVEISDLKNNSEFYHDEKIEASGYFFSAFENVAIYETKGSDASNALRIDFSGDLTKNKNEHEITGMWEDMELLNGKRITVQGDFDDTANGHLGQFIGTIKARYVGIE